MISVENNLSDSGLLVGVVSSRPIAIRPASEELKSALDKLVESKRDEDFSVEIKNSVRALLKTGGFKPSGRNKPASEYLAQAAKENRFPSINNLVDVNNLISLASGLPISLLDAAAIGNSLRLRFGRDGESYVFNAGGQEINLAGLICACAGESDTPLGNPVKDSMDGKLKESTEAVIGIIYCPNNDDWKVKLRTYIEEFAEWLTREGGAREVETRIV